MKFLKIALLLLAFTIINANAEESEQELVDIKVQLKWRHQFQFAGYYAAIEQGYYKDVGLNVTLLERVPGPTPIDKLILGNVDYAVGGVGALIYRANGVPIVALAAIYQHSPSVLISRFSNIEKLRHKKIMLSQGVMNAEITAMLRKADLKPKDYVSIASKQSLDSYIFGEIDAYNGYVTNETYQLNLNNTPFYSFHPKDFGVDFYGDILLTTERMLETDIAQVKHFRAATLKGWEYAVQNVDEVVSVIEDKYNSQYKTRAQLIFEANELVKLIYSSIVPVGYMNLERWYDIGEELRASGAMSKELGDIRPFLFSHHVDDDVLSIIRRNYELFALASILLLGIMMFLHSYRLRLIVKSKTSQLRKAREQAEFDARTDPLTGLANRRCFLEAVDRNLEIAQRNDMEVTLVYIDIDWFKNVNDTLGHAAGDIALTDIARILLANTRNADTACRTGGEEFVIVCLDNEKNSSKNLAERIRKEVEKHVFQYHEQCFQLTVSIGVAAFSGGESVEEVLKKSDQALYQAKQTGRNRVEFM